MKKVVSFLLILVICFSCVIPVFAEGDNYYVNETDLTPVTTWLSNLFSSIKEGFSDILTSITESTRSITNKIIDNVNKIETNLTKFKNDVRDWIVNIRNDIKSFVTTVNSLFYGWKDWFLERIRTAKTFFNDKINYLFVPTFKFSDKLNEWKNALNSKFPFLDNIKEMLTRITKFKETENTPKFEIEIYGTKVGIIDFSAYALVRKFIQGIILFVSWYTFLRRMYHSIPNFIMGAGGAVARVQDYHEEQVDAYWREHGGM